MMLSSYAALSLIEAGSMAQLNDYITVRLENKNSGKEVTIVKPPSLHFLWKRRFLKGMQWASAALFNSCFATIGRIPSCVNQFGLIEAIAAK